MGEKDDRQNKLRKALRDNLRKRKSQARKLGQNEDDSIVLRSRLLKPDRQDEPDDESGDS
ncbi:MAG: hypothetical protein JJ891_12795 [Rhizobiaceae bacterium]|jgi:hypothetical protein|nr:hypothetical protein [Rhizobiaceae bacterium]